MAAPTAVTNLQNQWYNTLAAAVGGNANFQIVQPNNPVSGMSTDDQVWQYFNNLPPASLNNNLTLSGGNQFFANYTGVLSQLVSNALTNFQSVLGSYYPLWQRYLASVSPLPPLNQLPNVFYTWAMVNAPTVAGPGRSSLAAALLDPIFAAQTMALNTGSFVNNTPNFTQGVSALLQQVANGGSVPAINFDSSTASSNVTDSGPGFFPNSSFSLASLSSSMRSAGRLMRSFLARFSRTSANVLISSAMSSVTLAPSSMLFTCTLPVTRMGSSVFKSGSHLS